jgi:hypothetical protein
MTSRAEATAAAGRDLALAADTRDTQTPEQVADAAWWPGHPHTKQQIADQVRQHRTQAQHGTQAA